MLQEFNLQRETPFSKDVLFRAARYLNEYGPKIRDLFWFGGFWVATTLEEMDSKVVPRRIAGSPVFFKSAAEVVGLFRFKKNENNQCLCVAATELRGFNYEICCGGRHRF